MNVIEERKVSDSMVETVHMVRPNHMNAAGRLFGGMLMQWLDDVAGLVAKRHTRSNVITASVDNLHFIHGAYQGEMVVIIGKVTYVGNSSMEVRVDTYVEHLEDGMRHAINRAYFTMVALDENDKPKKVPRLILEILSHHFFIHCNTLFVFYAVTLSLDLNISVEIVLGVARMKSGQLQFLPEIKEQIPSHLVAINIINKDYKRL